MKELSKLGMTDAATRRKPAANYFRLVLLSSLLVIVAYVVVQNYLFVQAGMLRPNFGQIHKAYNFNLRELPWTLVTVASAFLALGIFLTRRFLYAAALYALLALSLFALRYYVTHVEPERLIVHHVRLETPKLSQPIRLLHIADIQSGGIGDYEAKIFATIKKLKPDIILNTGDFLQAVEPNTTASELPKLVRLIGEVNPRYGTYAVYGDTDYLLYRFSLEDFAPMQFLASHNIRIKTQAGTVGLLGLNLSQSQNPEYAKRSISHWLDDSDVRDFRILFGHSPNFSVAVQQQPIDLCLAGHTHGGQVRLPFYGPLVIDSDVPKEWAAGFRRIGIPFLNVSAGAGSNRFEGLPPVRFNCPTEMTLIELVPVQAAP